MKVPKDFKVRPTNDLAFKMLMSEGETCGKQRLIDLLESILNTKVDSLVKGKPSKALFLHKVSIGRDTTTS